MSSTNGAQMKWDSPSMTLEEIVYSLKIGTLPPIERQKPGDAPVIKSEDIVDTSHYYPFVDECKTFLDPSNITNPKIINENDVIMFVQGSVNSVGKPFIYLGKDKPILGPNLALFIFKIQINPQYFVIALNHPKVQKEIQLIARKKNLTWNLVGITFEDLKKISIPVPSLERQEEIANLHGDYHMKTKEAYDTMKKLLEVRKKQYEWLKEEILMGRIDVSKIKL